MSDVLHVEKREGTGSAAARRLRKDGKVPVVLYGHGEENAHLAAPKAAVKLLLRHRAKMVQLEGDLAQTALISDMQFDPLGIEVLHIDLKRVKMEEQITVTVPIHIHGEPVGTREGGIFLENQRQVQVKCPAGAIPENIVLHVADIHAGENKTASDLELPDGVELVSSANLVLCSVSALKGAKK